MKLKTIAVCFFVLLLVGGLIFGLYHMENFEKVYYSQIDNTKIEALKTDGDPDDLKFEYTLDCYDQTGRKKELTFKTYRELKEGAYILLEVRSMGVHKWEEVQFDELPTKVQEKLK